MTFVLPGGLGQLAGSKLVATVARWDPATGNGGTLTNGNRTLTGQASIGGARCSVGLKTSGSWYTEVQLDANAISECIGFLLATPGGFLNNPFGQGGSGPGGPSVNEWGLGRGTNSAYRGLWNDDARTFPGGGSSAVNYYNPGDIVGLAIKMSNGHMWWSINGVWIQGNPSTDTSPMFNAGATTQVLLAATTYSSTAGILTIPLTLTYPLPTGFAPL